MLKRLLILLFLIVSSNFSKAQRVSMNQAGTLMSSFENPGENNFDHEDSRQYSMGFLLGGLSLYGTQEGPSQETMRKIIFQGYNSSDISKLSTLSPNVAFASYNQYFLMIKRSPGINDDIEFGFSWQIRSTSYGEINSQILRLKESYDSFTNNGTPISLAKNRFSSSAYHQLSFTARKDFNPFLSIGIKLGLLSGLYYADSETYNFNVNANASEMKIDYTASARLRIASAYGEYYIKEDNGIGEKPNSSISGLFPTFKNPGFSISLGSVYNNQNGTILSFNLKDLGFIKWATNSFIYNPNISGSATGLSSSEIFNNMMDQIQLSSIPKQQAFTAATPAYFDFSVSQRLTPFYAPMLVLGRHLTNPVGWFSLVNKFNIGSVHVNATLGMNTNELVFETLHYGLQFLVKRPNGEFFIGVEQLSSSIDLIKSASSGKSSSTAGLGVDFFLGYSFKFGQQYRNAGMSSYSRSFENGFWDWLFGWRKQRTYHSY